MNNYKSRYYVSYMVGDKIKNSVEELQFPISNYNDIYLLESLIRRKEKNQDVKIISFSIMMNLPPTRFTKINIDD